MITLKADERKEGKKPATLRSEGVLPVVLYGPHEETISLTVDAKEFGMVLKEAGESTVVTLKTSGGDKSVLIHEIQYDPVKDVPVHVDFYAVDMKKEVEVAIPLEFVGVSPAVKGLGGNLVKVMHEMTVRGLPANLPAMLEVDITTLAELDSVITASEVALPDGIASALGADEVIASISVAKEEEEDAPVADMADIEVEKKGKKEEEDASTE